MQQKRDFLIFLFAVLLLFAGWHFLQPYIFPKKDIPDPGPKVDAGKEAPDGKEVIDKPARVTRLPALPTPTPDEELISLGSPDATSADYELFVKLDPLGGGVRSVLLNKFRAADEDGRPKKDELLELVPDAIQRYDTAFQFLHFDLDDPNAERPLDTLGRRRWEVVRNKEGNAITETAEGQEVSFRQILLPAQRERELSTLQEIARTKNFPVLVPTPFSMVAAPAPLVAITSSAHAVLHSAIEKRHEEQYRKDYGITITRTYTLPKGTYHLGMKVAIERPKSDKGTVKFRYQLAGARGLPVEGKWYTSIFRDAYVVQVTDDNTPYREKQELRQISNWGGGNFVDKDAGKFIRYAGVGVQYFASVIVVDDVQEGGQDQKFLRRARPTLETLVVRGQLKSKGKDNEWIIIVPGDGKSPDETIDIPDELRSKVAELEVRQQVAVVAHVLSYSPIRKDTPKLALSVRTGNEVDATHWQWEDDITVRVNTEAIDLEPGDTVTHRYLLYHGPVKPSLLRHLRGDSKVNHELITRYADTLQLNQMNDYPSQGFPSSIGYYTGFSKLVVFCTNVIHRVLGWLTYVIPSYGICILILTILVRGLMFPLSRKQAIMSVKMQELGPEIKQIGEKFKDDQNAKGQAMMELYRKHGVNPLGSCWVMLLQMPVFMGLYYALQESIQFRLAGFWPTWIVNLAAPDMAIFWTRYIPVISTDAAYGGFLYLGPYLNVLPIVAVVLMLIQQKMMTPPPADEQQEMQQKMMKYMMIFMCLMFYKVAAGLCIYFIASSLWGFAERKMLPKAKKPEVTPEPKPSASSTTSAQQITATPPGAITTKAPGAVTTGKKGGRNKRKDREKVKEKEKDSPQSRLGQLRQRVSDWWNDVLEQARKK